MKMIQERLKLAEDRIREIAQEEGRIEGLPFFTFLASKITDLLAYARKIAKDGFVENGKDEYDMPLFIRRSPE